MLLIAFSPVNYQTVLIIAFDRQSNVAIILLLAAQ